MLSPRFYSVQAFLCNPATMTRDKAFTLPLRCAGAFVGSWWPWPGTKLLYIGAMVCSAFVGSWRPWPGTKLLHCRYGVQAHLWDFGGRDPGQSFYIAIWFADTFVGSWRPWPGTKLFIVLRCADAFVGSLRPWPGSKFFLFAATVCRRICGILEAVTRDRARTMKLTIVRQRDKLDIIFRVSQIELNFVSDSDPDCGFRSRFRGSEFL